MTDDELIAKLRDWRNGSDEQYHLQMAAADRIAQLTETSNEPSEPNHRIPPDDAIASMWRQLGVTPEKVRSIYERAASGPVVEVHHYDIEKHAESFNEGYEAAMTQHLADDPSAADDWLAGHDAKLQADWEAAADAVVADHGGEVPTLATFKSELARKLAKCGGAS